MLSEQSAIVTDTHGSWSLNGKVWERWKAGVCLGVATALGRETIEAAYALGQRDERMKPSQQQ